MHKIQSHNIHPVIGCHFESYCVSEAQEMSLWSWLQNRPSSNGDHLKVADVWDALHPPQNDYSPLLGRMATGVPSSDLFFSVLYMFCIVVVCSYLAYLTTSFLLFMACEGNYCCLLLDSFLFFFVISLVVAVIETFKP